MKKLFVCTPRMLVFEIQSPNEIVRYWDVSPYDKPFHRDWPRARLGDSVFVNSEGDIFEAQYICRNASSLPQFRARDRYEAEVDARAAHAHIEVQRAIRSMLRGVRYRG